MTPAPSDSGQFVPHIHKLVKRLKLKLAFYFRIKSCLSFKAKKQIVAAAFMSVLHYGDVLYVHASSKWLQSLHSKAECP